MSSSSYPPVLVGTDGSDSSSRAVDRAALVARDGVDGLITLVGARSVPGPAGPVLGPVPAPTSSRAPCDLLVVSTPGRGAKSPG